MVKVLIAIVTLYSAVDKVESNSVQIDRNLRIVGGSTARIGQFPHAAALVLFLTQSRSSFCGGSIIHPNFVLSVSVISNNIIVSRV